MGSDEAYRDHAQCQQCGEIYLAKDSLNHECHLTYKLKKRPVEEQTPYHLANISVFLSTVAEELRVMNYLKALEILDKSEEGVDARVEGIIDERRPK